MRIAVTGAAGLFGVGLVNTFSSQHEVLPLTRPVADITDPVRMREVVAPFRPEVVVHAAAIADIDVAEQQPELAYRVNTRATQDLTDLAEELGAAMAFISTDAVFDGTKNDPYIETDPMNPPSIYGKTKVAAEAYVRQHPRHFIFRVSVLFGPGKANFVNKGLCKAMGKEPYVVAGDQIASATSTLDAAETMLRVFSASAHGTFHLCNQGACSRYELATKALEFAGLDPSTVVSRPMSEMKRPGPRLKYSVMEMRALEQARIPLPRRWEDALAAYVKTLR